MNRSSWYILCLALITTITGTALTTHARYSGRFDAAGYGSLPDDDFFEDRAVISTRLQFSWLDDATGDWQFHSRIRLKEELETDGDGVRLQIWDFRLDYGLNKRLLGGSAGMCHMGEAPGVGSVLGIHLQLNPASWISTGVFGGLNPYSDKGVTDTDGIKGGAYITLGDTWSRRASLAFVSIGDRDDPNLEDTQTYTTAEIRYNWKKIVSLYQSAELDWSDPESDLRLTYYYGRIRVQPLKPIRFTVDYHHYHQVPFLQFQDQVSGDDDGTSFKDYYGYPGSGYRTWALTPGIDLLFGSNWRVYARYRHQETDYFGGDSSDRYSAGVACHDLWGSGIYSDAEIMVHRRDNGRDSETGRIEVGRDFKALNISLSYTGDRYWYGENGPVYEPVEDTHRAGLTAHYRATRHISVLLDLEHSFGDEDDSFFLLNFQYRF